MIRRYSDLRRLDTFEDRYKYLRLQGTVGRSTFGFDRYVNQRFYKSKEWRDIRYDVIVRDNGCDLGIEGYEINGSLLIHHMNPMDEESLIYFNPEILDPEYLITTTHKTHNAIHYGDEKQLPRPYSPRRAGDTELWERFNHG